MTILYSDTFTRGNSTSAGTTETGSKTWTGFGGATGGINSNTLYGEVGSYGGDAHFLGFDIGMSDNYYVETKFISASANFAALVFRAVDQNSFLHVQVLNNGAYILEGYVSGAYTDGGSSAGGIFVSGDVIRVKVQGNAITVYRNGTQIIHNPSIAVSTTGTKVGVNFFDSHGTAGNRFDDFKVEDFSTGGPTTYTQTVGSATVTPSSTVSKRLTLTKIVGSGTITPTGSLLQNIAGLAMSVGGAILTPIGNLAKRTYKGVGGVITAVGNAAKGLFKTVGGGSVTPSGTVSGQLNPEPPSSVGRTVINWVMKGLKNFFD